MVRLFDNTLRDGGNVVGHGFPISLTQSIIGGLLEAGIVDIECGNCKGVGAYAKLGATQAPSDEEYYDALQPYLSKGRIGMFLLAKIAEGDMIRGAAEAGLHFLRVGADAGNGAGSVKAVEAVKKAGLVCRYSLMKGYVLPAAQLAKEAKMLQDAGVDRITIMDSAGTMFPEQAADYVKALKDAVTIPVGFHGHSNLGLSQANALAAAAAGADEIDCGLLGMARSAGNCATELAAAHPSPLDGFDIFNYMAIIVFARGTTQARDLFHLWHDELQEKIRQGQGPWKDGEEKFRILWDGIACWPYLRYTYKTLKKLGINMVTSTYPKSWTVSYETGDIEGMARAYSGNVYPNRNLHYDVENMVNLARKFDLDGIIFHSNRSCKLMDFRQYEVQRRIFEECGVPSVIFDGDQTDPRIFSEAQYETRIQALAEMMAENKAKKGAAAQ